MSERPNDFRRGIATGLASAGAGADSARSDRERWNERYRESKCAMGEDPAAFLVECEETILRDAPGRTALDVACGEGRNSIELARLGFTVLGVDNADVALDKARAWAAREGASAEFRHLDLTQDELPAGPFDVVLVFNYLERDLFPALHERLAPGGLLVMESILATQANAGRHRAEFAAQPGEIERILAGLSGTIVTAREDVADERVRVLFCKDARP